MHRTERWCDSKHRASQGNYVALYHQASQTSCIGNYLGAVYWHHLTSFLGNEDENFRTAFSWCCCEKQIVHLRLVRFFFYLHWMFCPLILGLELPIRVMISAGWTWLCKVGAFLLFIYARCSFSHWISPEKRDCCSKWSSLWLQVCPSRSS